MIGNEALARGSLRCMRCGRRGTSGEAGSVSNAFDISRDGRHPSCSCLGAQTGSGVSAERNFESDFGDGSSEWTSWAKRVSARGLVVRAVRAFGLNCG